MFKEDERKRNGEQQGERKEEEGREIFTISMYGKKEQESRGEKEKNSKTGEIKREERGEKTHKL